MAYRAIYFCVYDIWGNPLYIGPHLELDIGKNRICLSIDQL